MNKREARIQRAYHQDTILSKYAKEGPFPFALILDHLKAGYNVGKIVRTANAFGCREVHLIGIGPFDPAPARGSLRHTRSLIFDTFEQSYRKLKAEGYSFFAFDPAAEQRLGAFPFPEKSAFIVGHEYLGIGFNSKDYPDVQFLKIAQFGKVESLNVSVAASIAAYEYLRQREFQTPGTENAKPHTTTAPPL